MGNLKELGRYFDNKLKIIVEVQSHSHGYYYIHFDRIIDTFEPDIILDKKFVNFEGRFSKTIPNPCGNVCHLDIKCLENNNSRCSKKNYPIIFKR